jgi:hypothetical protein
VKKNRPVILPLVLTAAIFFFCAPVLPQSQPEDLLTFLPRSNEAEGWLKERVVLRYRGEDLFEYINGGAEIYYEYGFKEVVIQDYKKNGHSLSLEIFEMIDPQSAYGIYSFKRSPEGIPLDTEAEGRLEGYYLNLWKGRYLITITGFDEEQETVNGLIEVAKTVESKIKTEKSTKPGILDRLPQTELTEASVKYFMGNLGLFNSYAFSRQNIFGLSEGVKGSYKNGYDIYILKQKKDIQPLLRFEQVKDFFRKEKKYKNFASINGAFSVSDEKNRIIYVESSGETVIIVLGAQNSLIAGDIAKKIISCF